MKRTILTIIFVVTMLFGFAAPKMHFPNGKLHDLGTIKEEKGLVKYTFSYKNTGDKPLVIISANESCGCTVSDYTKKPVAAGKKGKVTAVFNPRGKVGEFKVDIILKVNTPEKWVTLRLAGVVIPSKK